MKKTICILLAIVAINFQTTNFINAVPDSTSSNSSTSPESSRSTPDKHQNLKDITRGTWALAKGTAQGAWLITKGTGKLLIAPVIATGHATWDMTKSSAKITKEILRNGKNAIKVVFCLLQITAVLYGLDYAATLATQIGLPESVFKYSFGTMFHSTNQLFSSTITPWINAQLPLAIQSLKKLPGKAKNLHIILPRLWSKIKFDLRNTYDTYKFGKQALRTGTCKIDYNNPFACLIPSY